MSIEQKINYQLNKYPTVKKVVKRVYQTGMYAISPKIKSQNRNRQKNGKPGNRSIRIRTNQI